VECPFNETYLEIGLQGNKINIIRRQATVAKHTYQEDQTLETAAKSASGMHNTEA